MQEIIENYLSCVSNLMGESHNIKRSFPMICFLKNRETSLSLN